MYIHRYGYTFCYSFNFLLGVLNIKVTFPALSMVTDELFLDQGYN